MALMHEIGAAAVLQSRKHESWHKIIVYIPHKGIAISETRRRMLKSQVVLLEQDNVEFKVNTSMNSAIFLQASEEARRPLYHDRLETLNKCVLADQISRAISHPGDPKLVLHTDESSRYQMADDQLGISDPGFTFLTHQHKKPN